MTTMTHLPKKSIDWLQSLTQTNLDSRDGFRDAAENLEGKDAALQSMFYKLADQRDAQARELQGIVSSNDSKPTESGSVSAAAHRAWMDIRTALGGGAKAILNEAERGEDHIKAQYEKAIKDLGSCVCTSTLREHYAAVKESHDMVRDLRDLRKH